MRHKLCAGLAFLLLFVLSAGAAEIPPRPELLKFPPLTFTPPDPGSMRFELPNGIPVYARADRQLPLITVRVLFRGGKYLEPQGKEGLTEIASQAWRTGGAGDRTAQELDEELDFLAADLSTSIGDVTGRVRLNVLAKDFDTALGILMDVLTRPRFQEDRFAKAKEDLIQRMKERNDHAATIEEREWNRLIYGDGYWLNRLPTKASVDAVTVEDCKAFVKRLIRAGNLVLAVAGDFDPAGLRHQLARTLGTLPAGTEPLPEVPPPHAAPEPGVYVVNKPDVNQGRVSIGHLGVRQGHPDEFALRVMNHALGGSGFTSRITKRVRSDEGLAYHAASYFAFPRTYPGVFRAVFQSKSATVPRGIELVLEQIRDVRSQGITGEELETAKSSFIETFPRRFESAEATSTLYATDELLGRSHSYWLNYRKNIEKVTRKDAQEAAQKHLHPEKMVTLVVGNLEEILQGSPDYEAKLTDFGPIHRLPLRDPLTLEPLPE